MNPNCMQPLEHYWIIWIHCQRLGFHYNGFIWIHTVREMTDRPSSYPLRMPHELRKKLEARAEQSGRSLQKELLGRIQLTLELEDNFKDHLGSLDDLQTRIPELLIAERKTASLQEDIRTLQDQVKDYQKRYMNAVRLNDDGSQGKERRIQKLKGDMAKLLSDYEELFPSDNS